MQGGKPLFSMAADGSHLAVSRPGDLQTVHVPDASLRGQIISEDIVRLCEQLFSLYGLKCKYNPVSETLTLDFRHCHGEGCDTSLLPVLLGADFLNDKSDFTEQQLENRSYCPKTIKINLGSGKARYIPIDGPVRGFDIKMEARNPVERLNGIYLFLMQRTLGETVYNHQMLRRLQAASDSIEKESLLNAVSECDSPGIDDPERLGFRILLSDHNGELQFSLAGVNPQVATEIWGTKPWAWGRVTMNYLTGSDTFFQAILIGLTGQPGK